MGTVEWKVKSVNSEYSGDDGFDVTNSEINLENLTVIYPVEDGLNISSSTVTINNRIKVDMSLNSARIVSCSTWKWIMAPPIRAD